MRDHRACLIGRNCPPIRCDSLWREDPRRLGQSSADGEPARIPAIGACGPSGRPSSAGHDNVSPGRDPHRIAPSVHQDLMIKAFPGEAAFFRTGSQPPARGLIRRRCGEHVDQRHLLDHGKRSNNAPRFTAPGHGTILTNDDRARRGERVCHPVRPDQAFLTSLASTAPHGGAPRGPAFVQTFKTLGGIIRSRRLAHRSSVPDVQAYVNRCHTRGRNPRCGSGR